MYIIDNYFKHRPIHELAKELGFNVNTQSDCSRWLPEGCSPSDEITINNYKRMLKVSLKRKKRM